MQENCNTAYVDAVIQPDPVLADCDGVLVMRCHSLLITSFCAVALWLAEQVFSCSLLAGNGAKVLHQAEVCRQMSLAVDACEQANENWWI